MPDQDQKNDLTGSVKRGAVWTFIGRIFVFCINLGGSIILARLLQPEDFGLFGIALLFTGLATRFGNIGFGLALLQRDEINEDHISSLFTVNCLIFPSLAGLLFLISPSIGNFFGNILAGEALAILSMLFLATPFSSVARVLMQRKMDFKGPAIAETAQHFTTVSLAIFLAWQDYGLWSLVSAELAGAGLSAFVLVLKSKWKPKLKYKHAAMKDLFSFGVGIFLKRLLVYGSDKIDFFIIGKKLGSAPLGFYEKAFNLMNMTVKELGEKMEPVLFRAFSILQKDHSRILLGYNKVLLSFSLVSYPVFFGLAAVAPLFIPIVYGEKWLPSVIPLQIMCAAGLLRLHIKLTSTVMNAMGKVSVEVWIRAAMLLMLGAGSYIGSHWGIVGVSIAVATTNFVLWMGMTVYFMKISQMTLIEILRPQNASFAACVFMFAVVLLFQRWSAAAFGLNSLLLLLSAISVGALSYIAALLVIRPAPVLALAKELRADIVPVIRKFLK